MTRRELFEKCFVIDGFGKYRVIDSFDTVEDALDEYVFFKVKEALEESGKKRLLQELESPEREYVAFHIPDDQEVILYHHLGHPVSFFNDIEGAFRACGLEER